MIPVGDDVEHDSLPVGSLLLIAANVVMFLYMFRLDWDYHAANPNQMEDQVAELIASGEESSEEPLSVDVTDYENLLAELPSNKFIENWGISSVTVLQGQYLRLISHMFVHADFEHLLGNMLVLSAFMWTLEAYMGTRRFLLLYFGVGLLSSLGEIALQPHDPQIAIGASAAIAGVIGAYCLKFGPTTKINIVTFFFYRLIRFKVPAVVFAIFWIWTQWKGAALASLMGDTSVGWFAHGAGFAAGMILLPMFGSTGKTIIRDSDGVKRIVDIPDSPTPPVTGPAATEPNTTVAVSKPNVIPEPQAPAHPEICVYCQTELPASAMIAATLYRCPTAGCGRMHIAKSCLPDVQREPSEPWKRKRTGSRK